MTSETPSNGIEDMFSDGNNILILKRSDFLDGDAADYVDIYDDEIALATFFKQLAVDDNISGVALSAIHLGGIYTHVIVKDLDDKEKMKRTLDNVDVSFNYLNSVTNQKAGYHSYMRTGGKAPEEFANWFKEEFHKPPKYDEDSEEGILNFFELAGSKNELELLGIVMFEQEQA